MTARQNLSVWYVNGISEKENKHSFIQYIFSEGLQCVRAEGRMNQTRARSHGAYTEMEESKQHRQESKLGHSPVV